ncbi:MAG: hypothetical protein ACYDEP_02255 [Acidimicrobiales bacterium]
MEPDFEDPAILPATVDKAPSEGAGSSLPSHQRVESPSRERHGCDSERDDDTDPDSSGEVAYRVPTVYTEGETRMWAQPQYWDCDNYQGYWEDLDTSKPWWHGLPRAFFIAGLFILFFVPEILDGLWWLTLFVSDLVVGTIVILGMPRHRARVVLAVTSFVLVSFASLEAYNWLLFDTVSLWGPPPTILACGAEYVRTDANIAVPKGLILHRVGTTPSGLAVLGNSRCGTYNSAWAFVGVSSGKIVPYLEFNYSGNSVPPYSR